jgi:transcriptional regulator with XRE-family HTH domain
MAKSFDALVKRTTTKQTRARAAKRTRELLGEMLIGELRQFVGKSQAELAKELGIRQPSVSKLERQSDMQVSTLRRIVGELEIVASFPAGAATIRQGSCSPRMGARRKTGRSPARRRAAGRAAEA